MNNYIHPTVLPDKEEYYRAINNIGYSSSQVETLSLSITFLSETEQLLKNAITLFEMGFFDAAYYSLRESIELMLTILFFNEKTPQERDELLRNWKESKTFPGSEDMIKFCKESGDNYQDLINSIQSVLYL